MTCPNCRHRIRVLEDEEDLHSCPYCGWGRDEEDNEEEQLGGGVVGTARYCFAVDPKNPRVEVVIEDYEGGKPCYERKGKN